MQERPALRNLVENTGVSLLVVGTDTNDLCRLTRAQRGGII